MDAMVEDPDVLFEHVLKHLEDVNGNGSRQFNRELLKRAERNVDARCAQDLLWQLLETGESMLLSLQQDPKPLTDFLVPVIYNIPFEKLRMRISAGNLEIGLKSDVEAYETLCLAYLRTAAKRPSSVIVLSNSPSLVVTLLTLWFTTQRTNIASTCLDTVASLLTVDSELTWTELTDGKQVGKAQGQGLLWRRLFYDPSAYSVFFSKTSLKPPEDGSSHTDKDRRRITTAQGRLFDFIARIVEIDWTPVTTSTLPDVECRWERKAEGGDAKSVPYKGLLRYAAHGMVDKDDVLMNYSRHDFFRMLVSVAEEANKRGPSDEVLKSLVSSLSESPWLIS